MQGKEHMVSIVIPTWNQRKILAECLSSILSLKKSVKTEIIVVDDASSDDTVEYVKNHFPGIILLENRVNQGYAGAVNRGVERSGGNFIFLLNNDIRFVENIIDVLHDFLMKHKDAGAVAPLLVYPDEKLQISCRRFPTPAALILEKLRINKAGHLRKWKLTEDEHLRGGIVPQPMASALLIRRDCWEAVGSLDERFPIFFNDVDWCYRLYRSSGYHIYLCTDARAIHHEGATVNTLGLRKKREFYKGLMRFYLKHYPFRADIIRG